MKLLKQNYVLYGLIMSGLVALCLGYMEVTGQNQSFDQKSPIFVVTQFVAPAVVWWLGMRAKKKLEGGKLTYQEALREGIKISLVFAITSPFVFAAYYLINPAILDYVASAYNMIGQPIKFVVAVDMLVQFVAALFFGTIYAAVIAWFVKSRDKR